MQTSSYQSRVQFYIIGGSWHKYHFCRDKTLVCLLSWRKYACRDKTFVATKLCLSQQQKLSWHIFVAINTCLSRHKFVMTSILLLRQKTCFVTTNTCLSRQTYFCVTKVCLLQQIFVVTKIGLSWQRFCRDKHTFVTTKDFFCHDKHVFFRDKTFVVTKMILMAAPTNNSFGGCLWKVVFCTALQAHWAPALGPVTHARILLLALIVRQWLFFSFVVVVVVVVESAVSRDVKITIICYRSSTSSSFTWATQP